MLPREKWHETITEDRVIEAVDQDHNAGFCLACGDDVYGVEPDARRYKCETCGERQVYGAEELVIYLGGG